MPLSAWWDIIEHVFDSGRAGEGGAVLLDALPGWAWPREAWLPAPPEDVLEVSDFAGWDVPDEARAWPAVLPVDPWTVPEPVWAPGGAPWPWAHPSAEASCTAEVEQNGRAEGVVPGGWGHGGGGWDEWEQVVSDDPVVAGWASLPGLEAMAPDALLAGVLEQLAPAWLDEQGLVEAVAAWERVAAWAHLNSALLAGVLSRRESMNPVWSSPAPAETCVAGDELAMRLGWSRRAAARLVRDGRALGNELLLTADAVRDGVLDSAKLRAVTDRLHDRPGELAWAVQEAVLPGAATRTPTQLAADIDRALLAVSPQDTTDRVARAVAKRHVCHPRRLPDGMAGIWAVLPALDAAQVDATLEATARAARAGGDPRTLDQLRADTFTALATGHALLAGQAQWGTTPVSQPSLPVDPAPAAAANVVDLADRVGLPRARPPGRGAVAPDPDPPPSGGCGGPPVRVPKTRINVTVALSTLMGLDEQPGEIEGFGPIPADQARALAAGGTWRRLVTDPLTGAVLDVGRTRYRPPADLAEHVMVRDGVCAGPGCSTPAHRCDLDHTTEYHAHPANGSPVRGVTSADNLGPLCQRNHRLKTDGGFTLTQTAPGTFDWHTPAGFVYRVTPGNHGHTERLTGGERRRSRLEHPNPAYPDEPPF